MNTVRIVILAVAAVAAIGLALLLRNMASKPKAPAPVVATAPAQNTVRVLVAAHDLAVGAKLSSQDLSWQPWPAEGMSPTFFTDGAAPAAPTAGAAGAAKAAATAAHDLVTGGGDAMRKMEGYTVKDAIVKGEPIVARKLVRAGDGGYMSVVLGPGMRAMALPINAETGAGGFVQPGDRVDVIEAHQDTANHNGPGFVSRTVVSNVRVLAVDQNTDPPKNGKSIVGATVTLEVPGASSEQVAEARARGGITLALRSYADIAGGPGGLSTASVGNAIRVFKGGQASEVTVSR